MKYKEEEIVRSVQKLREWCKPGTTVWTVIRHVSRSGMQRSIDLYLVQKGEISRITYFVSRALGYSVDQKNGGVKVGGCGMDMGYHLVHNLSYALHGHKDKGKEAKEAGKQGRPFTARNARSYRAGYSLEHQWI